MRPFKKLLKKNKILSKKFLFLPGDINFKYDKNNYYLCKNRTIKQNKFVLLRSLNFDRHWYYYYNKPNDIAFNKKKNIIFWRGTTTGFFDQPANRFKLIIKWFKNPFMNIGFSFTCQGKNIFKEEIASLTVFFDKKPFKSYFFFS